MEEIFKPFRQSLAPEENNKKSHNDRNFHRKLAFTNQKQSSYSSTTFK